MPSAIPNGPPLSEQVDTVIIGNGPSALILSYILHGHIPYYIGIHPDELVNSKLQAQPNLLDVGRDVYSHFRHSLNYSSQALPFNSLLDSLVRPGGDTDPHVNSTVQWRHQAERAVSHLVLGEAERAGGQWSDSPVVSSWDIGTLSYAEQFSLPGYSIRDHWQKTKGENLPELIRPSRMDIASYFAAYPTATGIADVFRNSHKASEISRIANGFHIGSHNISCRHLVLASGIFNVNLRPPALLAPLSRLTPRAPEQAKNHTPVLIIGSGFTAADLIISTPPERKIIHIYNWDPENHPSPLKACHPQAYPEYATIYRQMRDWATPDHKPLSAMFKMGKAKQEIESNLPYFARRDWKKTYEGLPNARILTLHRQPAPIAPEHNIGTQIPTDTPRKRSIFSRAMSYDTQSTYSAATVQIGRSAFADYVVRSFGTFHYAVGRRGSLDYLEPELLSEVLPPRRGSSVVNWYNEARPALTEKERSASDPSGTGLPSADPAEPNQRSSSITYDFAFDPPPNGKFLVNRATLRAKIEESDSVEVAKDVFAIGSLTGDSLVRFAFGSAVLAAGQIVQGRHSSQQG